MLACATPACLAGVCTCTFDTVPTGLGIPLSPAQQMVLAFNPLRFCACVITGLLVLPPSQCLLPTLSWQTSPAQLLSVFQPAASLTMPTHAHPRVWILQSTNTIACQPIEALCPACPSRECMQILGGMFAHPSSATSGLFLPSVMPSTPSSGAAQHAACTTHHPGILCSQTPCLQTSAMARRCRLPQGSCSTRTPNMLSRTLPNV